jgi:hypothetical protein
MMLPKLMGSDLPSPGLARGGGVRDIDGSPGGWRFECEDAEEPGE